MFSVTQLVNGGAGVEPRKSGFKVCPLSYCALPPHSGVRERKEEGGETRVIITVVIHLVNLSFIRPSVSSFTHSTNNYQGLSVESTGDNSDHRRMWSLPLLDYGSQTTGEKTEAQSDLSNLLEVSF